MRAIERTEPPALRYRFRPKLLTRAAVLGLALLLEKYFLNLFVDAPRADAAQGFGGIVRVAQHVGFSFAVTLSLLLAVLVLVEREPRLAKVSDEARRIPVRTGWLGAHLALLVLLAASLALWHVTRVPLWILEGASIAIAVPALAALILALAPLSLWRRAAAALGARSLYAAAAAAIATLAVSWSQTLWTWTADVTFLLVRACLTPIVPALAADPTVRVLATDRFAVQVQAYCSGLEGIGLMLAFTAAWLLYFRREYIFPRALVLIPVGAAVIFGLNAVRIATLFLIGDAGYPRTAIYGFHSQAGWIAFNVAACGLVFVSHESTWLNRAARARSGPTHNPTAAYLLPLLLLLAAGMISHALSSGFEIGYGLRLLAGAAGLAICWRRLSALDWRFSWRGIAVGAAVFVLWLGAAHVSLTAMGMPVALAHMAAGERVLWIAARAATGLIVAPVVEELAYRGYLLRRLVAADFEAVPWTRPGWLALVLSAAAFAVMHGVLWWPALAAGIAYGLVLTRTGRMGEAVAAHAASNALIALWVLGFEQWQLW